MGNYLGHDVAKLGFGMMRLPSLESGEIDIRQVEDMVDMFMREGFNYFDTAYGYLGGKSESVVGQAVVQRYPREQFLLATKMPPWELKAPADLQRVFDTQLQRTGAGYFDYYMLHALGKSNIEICDKAGAWAFLCEQKAKGLARHIGCSFHDTADVLDALLTAHPELEFVQLQINYADWEDEGVQARLCYETVRKHGKSVIVMEPVKGGSLATFTGKPLEILQAVRPNASAASWAIRYAASLDGVVTVLSGMSALDQMRDNCATVKNFEPITGDETKTLREAFKLLSEIPTTPCTECKYCTEKCPANIPIPSIIEANNTRLTYNHTNKGSYAFITRGKGKASDCIACGVCESRCPQHIRIIELLKTCAEVFE
ncbi:MAG: aldo/keto reductase [Clostridia bacterium]|nr:aldo/keto reductase [Clostridia bacterium]